MCCGSVCRGVVDQSIQVLTALANYHTCVRLKKVIGRTYKWLPVGNAAG